MGPEKDLLKTAHHEAGHAVAKVKLGEPFRWILVSEEGSMVEPAVHQGLEEVDLLPPNGPEAAEELTWDPTVQSIIRDTMVSLAAGPISQMKYEQELPPYDRQRFYLFGGVGDVKNIRGYALGLAVLNSREPAARPKKRLDILGQTMEKAGHLVEDHWGLITALATHLHRVGKMDYKEVVAFLAATEDEEPGGADR